MKENLLDGMTIEQLVDRFAEITVEQGRAADRLNTRAYNRLYLQMMVVANELRQRPGDHRRALMVLYEHPQAQVRMMAAHMTLAIAYQSARDILQAIVDRKEFPQALDAGMSLLNLDKGVYRPT